MRNIFLLLLGVNILIFLGYFYLPESGGAEQKPLPANVPKLVLLSEVEKSALVSDKVAADKDQQAVPVITKQGRFCFTIGPFKEKSKIDSFRKGVGSELVSSSIRERTEKQNWRYWVYLENPGGREKAVKTAASLARKGLKDYYVIAKGEHKNRISLGHFRDKTLAQKRYEAIKAMQLKPKMEPITKEFSLFWLDFVSSKQSGLEAPLLEKFELDESVRQFNRECKK